MTRLTSILVLSAIGFVSACSDNPAAPGVDAGTHDSAVDAAHDANSLDATLDATTDAPIAMDSSVDAALDAAVDATVDSSTDDGATADAAADAAADGGADCSDEISALATLLHIAPRACSVTVRLDYETFAVLGYQVFCGNYMGVTDDEARATAEADTMYGADSTQLSDGSSSHGFIYYESPSDFGGASAVNSDNGLTVFGGSIVWDGSGDITYPSSWRPASDLGSGCVPAGGFGSTSGWDLQSGDALDVSDVNAALAVVGATGVPDAIWYGGYVFSSYVLLYPRSVGAFNPATAEWIVVVNGGWLE